MPSSPFQINISSLRLEGIELKGLGLSRKKPCSIFAVASFSDDKNKTKHLSSCDLVFSKQSSKHHFSTERIAINWPRKVDAESLHNENEDFSTLSFSTVLHEGNIRLNNRSEERKTDSTSFEQKFVCLKINLCNYKGEMIPLGFVSFGLSGREFKDKRVKLVVRNDGCFDSSQSENSDRWDIPKYNESRSIMENMKVIAYRRHSFPEEPSKIFSADGKTYLYMTVSITSKVKPTYEHYTDQELLIPTQLYSESTHVNSGKPNLKMIHELDKETFPKRVADFKIMKSLKPRSQKANQMNVDFVAIGNDVSKTSKPLTCISSNSNQMIKPIDRKNKEIIKMIANCEKAKKTSRLKVNHTNDENELDGFYERNERLGVSCNPMSAIHEFWQCASYLNTYIFLNKKVACDDHTTRIKKIFKSKTEMTNHLNEEKDDCINMIIETQRLERPSSRRKVKFSEFNVIIDEPNEVKDIPIHQNQKLAKENKEKVFEPNFPIDEKMSNERISLSSPKSVPLFSSQTNLNAQMQVPKLLDSRKRNNKDSRTNLLRVKDARDLIQQFADERGIDPIFVI